MKKIFFLTFFIISAIGFAQNDSIKSSGWKINSNKKQTAKPINVLYVVDGYFMNHHLNLKSIEPNIESMNVLKREAATSIYGQKGKNGAIVIKTKNIPKKELKRLGKIYAYEYLPNTGKPFITKGRFTDYEDGASVDFKVTNLNSKQFTITDNLGNFSIEVRKNDVLSFSILGFDDDVLEYVLIKNKKPIIIEFENHPSNENMIIKKPVIYLYPTEKTDVTIKLNVNGKLMTTFPKYEDKWDVTAEPDGQLFDKKTQRFYNSLFWDADVNLPNSHYQYESGFVVSKDKLVSFLIEKLEYIGLNNQETNEFIQFWLPILEENNYNFIHFLVNAECDEIATLKVNPKPETSIRIYMEFYGLENYTTIKEQQLPKIERKGFTLVEWGGANFNDVMVEEDFFKLNNLKEYFTISDKRKNKEDIKPLYVIDKKIASKKMFDKLHPNSIEKIEVFDQRKGTILYGEYGSDGVFDITTKNNKK